MGIGLKLLLAGLSGFLVAHSWNNFDAATDSLISVVLVYGLCGSLFAAGVLFPYLKREDLRSWRPVGLVIVSAASFYCAVYAATEWASGKWGPNLQDYVIASLIGAGIVLLASPPILALRYSVKYIALGVVAALIGGVLFGVSFDEFEYSLYLSFGSWHMVMCVALHLSNPSAAEDRWLASVKRSKLFIVVAFLALVAFAPLVDDGIGALIQDRYARNDGGLVVHDRVSAYGIRDERTKSSFPYSCDYGCLALIQDEVYAFQEYEVDDARGGYQLFIIGDRPDPNCHTLSKDWKSPLKPTFQGKIKLGEDRCLTYRIVDKPLAKYAIRESKETVNAGFGLYSLHKTTRQVVRLSDNTTVVEASYYVYYSRFDYGATIGAVESWAEFLQQALPLASGEWQPPLP